MKLNEKSTPAQVGSQPYAMKKWPGSLLANDNDRAIVTRNVDAIVMAMIDLTAETDDGFPIAIHKFGIERSYSSLASTLILGKGPGWMQGRNSVRLATIFAPRAPHRESCIEWGLVPSHGNLDKRLATAILNH